MNDKEFLNFKKQTLKGIDLSKKGEVDVLILNIIESLNSHKSYVTLSSCSGRTIVVSQNVENLKKGCQWIYTTHDRLVNEDFVESCVQNQNCDMIVKFEPFILHVACQNLESAKKLVMTCFEFTKLNCALNCGYRNSGIVLGANNKITLAIRSTLNIEVPISKEGKLLVDSEYLKFVGEECNLKMDKNMRQIEKFEAALKASFINGDS